MTSIWDNVMARTTEKLDNWKGETIRATQVKAAIIYLLTLKLVLKKKKKKKKSCLACFDLSQLFTIIAYYASACLVHTSSPDLLSLFLHTQTP